MYVTPATEIGLFAKTCGLRVMIEPELYFVICRHECLRIHAAPASAAKPIQHLTFFRRQHSTMYIVQPKIKMSYSATTAAAALKCRLHSKRIDMDMRSESLKNVISCQECG